MNFNVVIAIIDLFVIILLNECCGATVYVETGGNICISFQLKQSITNFIRRNETSIVCYQLPSSDTSNSVVFGWNNRPFTCQGNSSHLSVCIDNIQSSDDGQYFTLTSSISLTSERRTLSIASPPSVQSLTGRYPLKDTNLNVKCEVTPGSPPTYSVSWKKLGDENFNQNGDTLRLINVQPGESGTYICTAENVYSTGIKGSSSQNMSVDVVYSPSVAAFIKRTPVEGSNLSVNCHYTPGNPAQTTLLWTKSGDSTFAQAGVTLQISKIQRSNAGTYVCTAENRYPSGGKGTSRQSVAIDVLYGPSVTSFVKRTRVEGSDLSVNCDYLPGNPTQTTLLWTKSGDSTFAQARVTLQISKIQRSNAGSYICTAENVYPTGGKGTSRQSVAIDVLYPPVVSISPSNLTVVEGQTNVSLKCNVVEANPSDVTYTWIPATSPSSAVYTISNVMKSHNREYKCSAKNSVDASPYAVATVNVIYIPVITTLKLINGSENVTEHSRVRFICEVKGQVSTITWRKVENNTVVHTDHNTKISYLTIQSVNCLDMGSYAVSAENEYGFKSKNITVLLVQCSPRLYELYEEQQPLNVDVIQGETLIINLGILSNPTPSITDIEWNFHSINGTRTIKDGINGFSTTSNLAKIKQRVVLIKMKITTRDYGKYTVLVKNEVGQLKQDFEVRSLQRKHCDDNEALKNLGTIIFGTLFGILCAVSGLLAATIFYMTRKMKNPIEKKQQTTGRDVYDELQEAKKDENKYEDISKNAEGKETSGRGVYDDLQETTKDENKYEAISRQTVDTGKHISDNNTELAKGDEDLEQMYEYPDTEQLKLKKIKSTK